MIAAGSAASGRRIASRSLSISSAPAASIRRTASRGGSGGALTLGHFKLTDFTFLGLTDIVHTAALLAGLEADTENDVGDAILDGLEHLVEHPKTFLLVFDLRIFFSIDPHGEIAAFPQQAAAYAGGEDALQTVQIAAAHHHGIVEPPARLGDDVAYHAVLLRNDLGIYQIFREAVPDKPLARLGHHLTAFALLAFGEGGFCLRLGIGVAGRCHVEQSEPDVFFMMEEGGREAHAPCVVHVIAYGEQKGLFHNASKNWRELTEVAGAGR